MSTGDCICAGEELALSDTLTSACLYLSDRPHPVTNDLGRCHPLPSVLLEVGPVFLPRQLLVDGPLSPLNTDVSTDNLVSL